MSLSINMIVWFRKTYSHKPIKILQFLSRGENLKMFNMTSKYFSIFNDKLPASWVSWTNFYQIFNQQDSTELKKNAPNTIIKYFTANFYFEKVTRCSGKITCKTKHFSPNNKTYTPYIFFHQIRKVSHEALNFLHQINNFFQQNDCTFGLP